MLATLKDLLFDRDFYKGLLVGAIIMAAAGSVHLLFNLGIKVDYRLKNALDNSKKAQQKIKDEEQRKKDELVEF